ncbi:MAG TPA: CoA-binding protein, partial [Frankiaceae bacterium]|nr:CoA-binding protein [Frankiaceae bacterium]
FTGPVYPVNRNAVTVAGLPAHASLADLPGPVDLAVLAVPAAAVSDTVRACSDRGVRAVVVLTAGFADAGERGAGAQSALVTQARAAGMRLLGPNCLGVGNTAPDVRLDATFAPVPLPRGRVGVATQSGGLGIALLQQVQALELGVSTFVSFGNKADVSANDLLLWYEHDDDTDLVVLYLESFGNPRKFARLARRIGRHRPVVAVKGGRSEAGTRGARSHTAAAAANPAVPVDALFTQSGVVAVDTLGELCEAMALLACQPLPSGPGVAVVSNAGGPGILAADAASAAGLTVPELGRQTQRALRALLPTAAAVANPVGTIASVSGADFERAIRVVLADPGVDAVLAVVTYTAVTGPDELTRAVVAAAAGTTRKPLAAAILGQPRFVAVLADPAGKATVPASRSPRRRRGPSPVQPSTPAGAAGRPASRPTSTGSIGYTPVALSTTRWPLDPRGAGCPPSRRPPW